MIDHTNLIFGIPSITSKKQEKYPDMGVITLLADAGKGTSKKLDLNTYLVEALALKLDGEDSVNFAFVMDGNEKVVYFANTTNMENPTNMRVTKTGTVSNKKMYDYLAKVFELDTTKDNELLVSNIQGTAGKVSVLIEATEIQESELASADLIEEFNTPEGALVSEVTVLTSDEDNHENDVILG